MYATYAASLALIISKDCYTEILDCECDWDPACTGGLTLARRFLRPPSSWRSDLSHLAKLHNIRAGFKVSCTRFGVDVNGTDCVAHTVHVRVGNSEFILIYTIVLVS